MDFRSSAGNGNGAHSQDKNIGVPKKATFIDLFAGCGGLSLGLLSAGWTGLFAVERDDGAFSTLDANLISGTTGAQIRWPSWLPPQRLAISSFLRVLETDRRFLDYLRWV